MLIRKEMKTPTKKSRTIKLLTNLAFWVVFGIIAGILLGIINPTRRITHSKTRCSNIYQGT